MDNVNHPKYYESECSLECIEVMRLTYGRKMVWDFCICNAFKYLWRYKNKNGKEDLRKAEWYIRYVEDGIEIEKGNYSITISEYKKDVDRLRSLLESLWNKIAESEESK